VRTPSFAGARWTVLFAACALLAACGDGDSWFGSNAPPPLPGTRVSVLDQATVLAPDAPDRTVRLPPPELVPDWPEAGGFPPHAMWHLALGDHLQRAWTADVGEGAAKRRAFITQPIVAAGRVFAMDAESNVSAFDLKNGSRFWRVELAVKGADNGTYGGGLAYDRGTLFVTDGYGEIVSLDPRDGRIRWRKTLPAPVRGAPTARAGRLLMITVTNETLALAEDDGRELWTHNGLEEETFLVGGTSPAVVGNTVIAPYSSGELFALRIENGAQLWTDSLNVNKRTDQVATLTDIRGLPVIDNGRVFAAGNSDILVALDLATGRRLWDRDVGSVETPWVAGNFLYLITNAPAVVCFRADTGQVVWVAPLAEWEDPEAKSGRIVWTGPLLASDRLIVASSTGGAYSISPYTGKLLGQIALPNGVTIAPIVADKTLIFVTDSGELVAYR
jgi:outer membrane protein assembly factor BamB